MEQVLAWDQSLFLLINKSWTSPVLDAAMPVLTDLHKNIWFVVVVIPLLLGLLVWKERTRALWILLALGLAVGAADAFSYRVVKGAIDRGRPEASGLEPILRTHSHSGSSFPSNHAANMFALGLFLSLLYRRLAIVFLSFAALIAYSRIYVGVHFPLDVLAGSLIGCLFGFLLHRAFDRLEARRRRVQPYVSQNQTSLSV